MISHEQPCSKRRDCGQADFLKKKIGEFLIGEIDIDQPSPFALSGGIEEKGSGFLLALGGLFELVGQQANHLVKPVVPLHF